MSIFVLTFTFTWFNSYAESLGARKAGDGDGEEKSKLLINLLSFMWIPLNWISLLALTGTGTGKVFINNDSQTYFLKATRLCGIMMIFKLFDDCKDFIA